MTSGWEQGAHTVVHETRPGAGFKTSDYIVKETLGGGLLRPNDFGALRRLLRTIHTFVVV